MHENLSPIHDDKKNASNKKNSTHHSHALMKIIHNYNENNQLFFTISIYMYIHHPSADQPLLPSAVHTYVHIHPHIYQEMKNVHASISIS